MRPVSAGASSHSSEAEIPARSAVMGALTGSVTGANATAKASMVNRTHRVVRERARTMQANRSRMRGLLIPLMLCSSLMILLFAAFWVVLEQYEVVAAESPAHSHHLFLLLLWFLPVSVALVAMIWFRRSRNQTDTEAIR